MFDGIPIADFAPATLLGITVVLILLGRLIPRSTYIDKAEEAERWRMAYETERDARSATDTQTVELLELAKTSKTLLEAVVHISTITPQTGGDDVVAQTRK